MMPRLYLAKCLLREDGAIFVSIDDNEVHNLRLLMNEIFGEENFVAQVIWGQGRKSMAAQVAVNYLHWRNFQVADKGIDDTALFPGAAEQEVDRDHLD